MQNRSVTWYVLSCVKTLLKDLLSEQFLIWFSYANCWWSANHKRDGPVHHLGWHGGSSPGVRTTAEGVKWWSDGCAANIALRVSKSRKPIQEERGREPRWCRHDSLWIMKVIISVITVNNVTTSISNAGSAVWLALWVGLWHGRKAPIKKRMCAQAFKSTWNSNLCRRGSNHRNH